MSEDEKTKPEAKKEIGNSGETKPAQEPEPKPAAEKKSEEKAQAKAAAPDEKKEKSAKEDKEGKSKEQKPPAEQKKRGKKISRMTLTEIESALEKVKGSMRGLNSSFARHLLDRKKQLAEVSRPPLPRSGS